MRIPVAIVRSTANRRAWAILRGLARDLARLVRRPWTLADEANEKILRAVAAWHLGQRGENDED